MYYEIDEGVVNIRWKFTVNFKNLARILQRKAGRRTVNFTGFLREISG